MSLLGLVAGVAGAGDSVLDACRDAVRRDAAHALVLCGEAEQTALAARDSRIAGLAAIEHAGAAIALARYEVAAADLARADPLLRETQWRDRHRLERQRGTLAFRRERLAEAALHYGRSLEIARSHDDVAAQAQGWNDVGIVYRRVGDYAQALEAFTTSLALRERLGETDRAAAVLNNLGNLQQDLGDYAAAQTWLERALAAYRAQDAPRQVAHVLESLGINDRHLGRDAGARDRLRQAWDAFTQHDAPRDRLRVATHLARLEARLGDEATAQRWIDEATTLAATLQQSPSLALLLAIAQAGDAETPRRTLRERLHAKAGDPLSDRVDAWEFLAAASERDGDAAQALDDLKALQTARAELAQTAQNERVAQWQVRLDVADRLREIEALREQNRVQSERLENERLRRYLTLAISLAGLALIAAMLLSRLQRQRAQAAVQRLALEHQSAHYRSAADALRADRRRLQALVDRSAEALLLVDARGNVLAANRAAGSLLGRGSDALIAAPLAALLGPDAERLGATMAASENADEEREEHGEIALTAPGGAALRAAVGLLDDADAEEPVVWLK
ncbi:MAG TPA: tetratricopeptide repeat protein, partial [Tahibacter sp.]|uniref:tetratricopeptide repeat protein n=1 Tax=Tahibacter sp. TaxID=2056211 RepID=UPI002CBA8BDF